MLVMILDVRCSKVLNEYSICFYRENQFSRLILKICFWHEFQSYFFALNHHNYARWIIHYHHNLVKLPSTHADVFDEFNNGFFAIHQIEKSFSN